MFRSPRNPNSAQPSARIRQIPGIASGFFLCLVGGFMSVGLSMAVSPTVAQPVPALTLPIAPKPGLPINPASQDRVNEELLKICGDYRCDGIRYSVHVPIASGDTLESLEQRLDQAMINQINQAFQSRPNIVRVIVDGSIYRGSEKFKTLEVPVKTVFVPRNRWKVGRFGITQDSIVYNDLVYRVADLLIPPSPSPTPVPPGAATPPAGGLPPLPSPLPGQSVPPVAPEVITPAPAATATPAASPPTPTPSPSPTATPRPTPTPIPTAQPGFGNPGAPGSGFSNP